MTNERQLQIVEEHIRDAVERGAQIRIGGKRLNSNEGWFHEPTVLTNVDHSMMIMRDETFGPVLPIKTFKSEARGGATCK
jgi:acyl-CoA reductase-like NAD-dependent aldehyde dehydrogenase